MPPTIPFLSLKHAHTPIRERLHECARRVIDSGVYINGPECETFASELSEYLGLGKVVPVSNGLDAIRLILRGYMEMGKLNEGDEVIVPANTYIATVLPVTEFGLIPLLAAPDLSTYGIDWEAAEKLITPETKALITVHLYGTPSWDFETAQRMRELGILLIEDNAQAIGATVTDPLTRKEISTGALGDAAAFSFYPTKNMGALGDAGAVATTDNTLAATVKALANYGSTRRYYNEYNGYNCRMDEMQAAFLRLKLEMLEETTQRRRENAQAYNAGIRNPMVTVPEFKTDMKQVWHQYVVRSPLRDKIIKKLREEEIASDIHYPLSLFDQPCYSNGKIKLGRYGNAYGKAKKLASEVLSLPIADVTQREIKKITDIINNISYYG